MYRPLLALIILTPCTTSMPAGIVAGAGAVAEALGGAGGLAGFVGAAANLIPAGGVAHGATTSVICGMLPHGVMGFTAAGLLYGAYTGIKCAFYECCAPPWVLETNFDNLKAALNARLYGQPLVTDVVVHSLRSHFSARHPAKPLVLSFHGPTGCGKNYVTKIIAEHLYKRQLESSFFHVWLPLLHFPDPDEVVLYKKQLQHWIRGNVTACERSIFVFDEMDRMMPDLIDALLPFIDYRGGPVDGVDYRKATFVFLSNSGSNLIISQLKTFWGNGRDRDTLKLQDMEQILKTAAYNENGGFQKSPVIKQHVIDHFIPFLPLQVEHIRHCITDEYVLRTNRTAPTDFVNEVNDMLDYSGVFATQGCKQIAAKVGYRISQLEEEERDLTLTHVEL